jgi:hypothetical protein
MLMGVLGAAEDFFNTELVDLEGDQEMISGTAVEGSSRTDKILENINDTLSFGETKQEEKLK